MHSIMIFNKHTYHDAIIMMFFIIGTSGTRMKSINLHTNLIIT